MSHVVHDLRPEWQKCAVCGVTQPLTSLRRVEQAWQCTNAKKCAQGEEERAAEFGKLVVRPK